MKRTISLALTVILVFCFNIPVFAMKTISTTANIVDVVGGKLITFAVTKSDIPIVGFDGSVTKVVDEELTDAEVYYTITGAINKNGKLKVGEELFLNKEGRYKISAEYIHQNETDTNKSDFEFFVYDPFAEWTDVYSTNNYYNEVTIEKLSSPEITYDDGYVTIYSEEDANIYYAVDNIASEESDLYEDKFIIDSDNENVIVTAVAMKEGYISSSISKLKVDISSNYITCDECDREFKVEDGETRSYYCPFCGYNEDDDKVVEVECSNCWEIIEITADDYEDYENIICPYCKEYISDKDGNTDICYICEEEIDEGDGYYDEEEDYIMCESCYEGLYSEDDSNFEYSDVEDIMNSENLSELYHILDRWYYDVDYYNYFQLAYEFVMQQLYFSSQDSLQTDPKGILSYSFNSDANYIDYVLRTHFNMDEYMIGELHSEIYYNDYGVVGYYHNGKYYYNGPEGTLQGELYSVEVLETYDNIYKIKFVNNDFSSYGVDDPETRNTYYCMVEIVGSGYTEEFRIHGISSYDDIELSYENDGFMCSDWAENEVWQAFENDLIPKLILDLDLTYTISRKEFAAVAVELYENLSGEFIWLPSESPFYDVNYSDLYYDYILKAYEAGFTTGTDDHYFSPNDNITREQLATMLGRVIKKYKFDEWNIDSDSSYNFELYNFEEFYDDYLISDYARNSVYFMAENNIVNGIGGALFAPLDTASREEAVLISLRIFDIIDNINIEFERTHNYYAGTFIPDIGQIQDNNYVDAQGYATFYSKSQGFRCKYPSYFSIGLMNDTYAYFSCHSPDKLGQISVYGNDYDDRYSSTEEYMNNFISGHDGVVEYTSFGEDYFIYQVKESDKYSYRFLKIINGKEYSFLISFPEDQFEEYANIISYIYADFIKQFQ